MKKKLRWVAIGAAAFGVAIGVCTKSGYYGFHGGFLAAFAFGITTKRLLGSRTVLPAPRLDPIAAGFDAGETILHFGPANHFKGLESVRREAVGSRRHARSGSSRTGCSFTSPTGAASASLPAPETCGSRGWARL